MALRGRKAYSQLEDLPFFSGWTRDELAHVDKVAERVSFEAGDTLIRQGSLGYEFIVILDGEADIAIDGEHIATVGAGDHVGEMALLDGGPRTATVTASTQVHALLVGTREFRALVAQAPSLDRKLLVSLTRRLRQQ